MASLKYWLWLTGLKGLGAPAALRLLDWFVTPERVYYADPEEYDLVEGLSAFQRKALLDKSMDRAEGVLADCQYLGLRIMTIQDGDYPDRLRQIPDPPVVLYLRGKNIDFDEEAAIAVVGAREPSEYGRKMAARLGLELARGGALLVSGIARGLDSEAIRGALKGGGQVVSVLAGGLDTGYPYTSRFLVEDIAAAGTLISEYPPGTPALGDHYHARNRIISGLSLGVVAVECRLSSGTMITAGRALEQDRDLFAVPGAVDMVMSEGTNRLIQQGAKLVTCGGDILSEYWARFPRRLAASAPLTPEAAQARLDSLAQDREEKRRTDPALEEVPSREFIPRSGQRERFTDDEHLKAWLLRVTINCCNDVHRSPWSKRRAELDDATLSTLRASELDEPGREAPDDAFGNRNLEPGDLAAALARLTPQQRTAVHLFYFEGYATDEIAQITGERSGTVRSHLHRARKALKINLGAHS